MFAEATDQLSHSSSCISEVGLETLFIFLLILIFFNFVELKRIKKKSQVVYVTSSLLEALDRNKEDVQTLGYKFNLR